VTPEQLEEAQNLIANGATYAEISERMSVSVDVIQGYFSGNGLHRELRRWRNDKIFEMLQEGKTAREISEVVGLTLSGTRNILAKMRKYAKQK
jgi:hypothetical protein